jgi:hypothetical protein
VKAFAYVTAVVLVVIGISLATIGGLPAASPPVRTYGHGLLRFSAAFPTKYTGSPRNDSVRFRPRDVFYEAVEDHDNQRFTASVIGSLGNDGGGTINIDYSGGSTTRRNGETTTSWPIHCITATGAARNPGLTADVHGFTGVSCVAKEVVSANEVIWIVQASSPRTPTVAEAFVRSFRPASRGKPLAIG